MKLQVIVYRSCYLLVGLAAKVALICLLVPQVLASEVKPTSTTTGTGLETSSTIETSATPAVSATPEPTSQLNLSQPSPSQSTPAQTAPGQATTEQAPTSVQEAESAKPSENGIPVLTEAEFATPLGGGTRIISPAPRTILDTPATAITAQFPEGNPVELRVNGKAVQNDLIGRTEVAVDTQTGNRFVTQTWYGVSLKGGENKIELFNTAGGVIPAAEPTATTTVQVRGEPKRLVVEIPEAKIPADGRSTATVRGQLLDADGNRSNFNAIVTLSANAGEFIGKDQNPDQDGFQVEVKQGEFTAKLQSGLEAKTVRVRAATGELEAFTQLEFETSLRPTILTGVIDFRLGARGTDYFGRFEDYLPPDGNNSTQLDVTAKGFGQGRIGNWALTAAYNSDRGLNNDCNGRSTLNRADDTNACDRYPVYGDSSTVDRVVKSQDSLYLRIERNKNYFMWGDYGTEEFATASQLYSGTTRSLHGFKGNYHFGKLQVTALYGDNVQGFQRDTIAPDGTSGFYFVSRRLLVPGSENIYVEQEEINRPGTVVRRTLLNRDQDYDIDYDRGTLLFKRAILRTDVGEDGTTLVQKIVATYQYDNRDGNTSIYGGRLRYHFSNKIDEESSVGATYLKESEGSHGFELYGGDFIYSFGKNSRVIAEYAHSQNSSEFLGEVSGSAYRVEYDGQLFSKLKNKTYFRQTETGFTNNATTSFVPGQTRYGTEFTAQVSPKTNVSFKFDHEDNNGIAPQVQTNLGDLLTPRTDPVPGTAVDNSLTTIDAQVQQKIGKAIVDVGIIHRQREDRQPTNLFHGSSTQFNTRVRIPLRENLSLISQYEQTLASGQDPIYPSRVGLGLEWKASNNVRVGLSQQFTFGGGQYSGRSITSLDIKSDYELDKDTTVTSRYTIQGGASGISTQRSLGLNHKLVISPGLRLNFAYERIQSDQFGYTGAGLQFAQPFAAGSGGASVGVNGGESYGVGFEYTNNPNFKASAKLEHRTFSNSGVNTVFTAALAGKLTPSLTALMDYRQASSANQTIANLGTTRTLKLGVAYRNPAHDRLNALLRYEYRQNPSTIPDTLFLGSGTGSQDHTLALETIYAPHWRWEFYGKVALRYSTSYLAKDYVGSSFVGLSQFRATYRITKSIDVAADMRFISQSSPHYFETGVSLEAGYYLTPNLRLAGGYAFGSASDRDFSGGNRHASGPYLNFTVKLDQLFQGFGIQQLINPKKEKQPEVGSKPEPLASQANAAPVSDQPQVAPAAEPTQTGGK